jgi:hypothetical protein
MSINRITKLAMIVAILSVIAMPLLAGEGKTYGAGVTLEKPVPLLELLDDPESWVGKSVLVKGTIEDVCPRMGCWINIVGKDAKRHVRLKVKDGEIVFPVEAKGHKVAAQGVFEKIEMSEKEAVAWARHMADEKGEPFDETAEVPTVMYQIRGTGAVIQ